MEEKWKCSGCTACQHCCPTKCIIMQEDKEGFLYPKIKEAQCIHCNKCRKVCPMNLLNLKNNSQKQNSQKVKAYVGYSLNQKIRLKSSSGGIFSLLAEEVLKQNGTIFGAAFDENFLVHHIEINHIDELDKLRGSKYIQSRLEDTFFRIKELLDKEKLVLFSGTACQIAGVKSYLGKEYENFITIDILCHGVPSTKVWEMYLNYQKSNYQSAIKSISLRNKKNGWKDYSVRIEFENGKEYMALAKNDLFINMFLSDICLRPSCYQCEFKEMPRKSDITIGDCWGIEKYMPEIDDNLGISIILAHSKKGEALLKMLENRMNLVQADLKKILPKSAKSRQSARKHPNRKKYLKGIELEEPLEKLLNYKKRNIIQKIIAIIQYEIDVIVGKFD